MNKYIDRIRLSADALKIIACISMLIDHISYGLLNYYMTRFHMDIVPQTYTKLNTIYKFGHSIGRIAFPIFCFFLVEGFFRTRNLNKYMARILLLAVISEIPFDLALYHTPLSMTNQNTLFTLFTGLTMMCLLKYIKEGIPYLPDTQKVIASLCAVAGFAELASLAHLDYTYKGMLLIATLYFLRGLKDLQLISGAAITAIFETCGSVAFLPLYFYDPEVKPRFKYLFYCFYPAHLILIYLVALLLFR